MNGATCLDLLNSFQCQCPPTTAGKICDVREYRRGAERGRRQGPVTSRVRSCPGSSHVQGPVMSRVQSRPGSSHVQDLIRSWSQKQTPGRALFKRGKSKEKIYTCNAKFSGSVSFFFLGGGGGMGPEAEYPLSVHLTARTRFEFGQTVSRMGELQGEPVSSTATCCR